MEKFFIYGILGILLAVYILNSKVVIELNNQMRYFFSGLLGRKTDGSKYF